MAQVLLSIGSNIDKRRNIALALSALGNNEQLSLVCHSRIYETVAIGSDGKPSDQPSFHNLAAKVVTELSVACLTAALRAIEEKQGRIRTSDKFAPRPIDLDIVLYDLLHDGAYDSETGYADFSNAGTHNVHPNALPQFNVPDTDIANFPHLACPLAEVAPQWRIPTFSDRDHTNQTETLKSVAERLLDDKRVEGQVIQVFEIDEYLIDAST